MTEYLFSSESVSEGHPDKVADQISDAVLDTILTQDPQAKVACETVLAKNLVVVGGEFKTDADFNIPGIVRSTLKDIGYTDMSSGIDCHDCEIKISISKQSANINAGVERDDGEVGAGDQGMMFGYAVKETPEMMPLAISLAHKIVMKQSEVRKSGAVSWLGPDAKSQVTVRYREDKPVEVTTVVLSTQHLPSVHNGEIRDTCISQIIEKVIPAELRSKTIKYLINPAGRFEFGGPQTDTGLTGRKIIVDTYGGSCPHGGGAFSGKDPTKVDRSAAYMARYVAKNIVAAGLAERCTLQLAYAIGVVDPVSVMVCLHGTGNVDEQQVEEAIRQIFTLKPRGIIETLKLRQPIYQKTAAYGHFGRELPTFTWENVDKVRELNHYFNIK